MYYIKLLRSYSTYRSNIARTYIRLFKIVRTCNIYIMDHKIISPDIDGSCDVYSSLKFATPLLTMMTCFCIDSLYRIYSPNIIYCVTFIVKITLLLLQKYNYNKHYITCIEDHYYTVIITTKLWITTFYHVPSEDEVVIIVNSLLFIHYRVVSITYW